jgi:hypothetical protein
LLLLGHGDACRPLPPPGPLVTDGIYRVVRNPSYLGLFILSLGWALAFRSMVGVLLVMLMKLSESFSDDVSKIASPDVS